MNIEHSLSRREKVMLVLKFISQVVQKLEDHPRVSIDKLNIAQITQLKLAEQLMILRYLQIARVVEGYATCFIRKSCLYVERGAFFEEISELTADIKEDHNIGAAIIWYASLRPGLLHMLINHAVKNARPRMQVILPQPEETTPYDRIVLTMYEEGILQWPKSIGSIRGKYVTVYKPVNDAMYALALAAAVGLILLRDDPSETVAIYTSRQLLTRSKRKTLIRRLGDLEPANVILSAIKETTNIPTLPLWQMNVVNFLRKML